jgi:hypothetical protein
MQLLPLLVSVLQQLRLVLLLMVTVSCGLLSC